MEFVVPGSWQKATILHTIAEFVEFCERLELTEPETNTIKKMVSFNHNQPIPKKRKTNFGLKAGSGG